MNLDLNTWLNWLASKFQESTCLPYYPLWVTKYAYWVLRIQTQVLMLGRASN